MYFALNRKEELANPYTVQLILDEDTKQRHEKYIQEHEKKAIEQEELSNLKLEIIEDSSRENLNENPTKKDIIEDILKTDSDAEEKKKKGDVKKSHFSCKPEELLQYSYHIPRGVEKPGKVVQRFRYLFDEMITDLGFKFLYIEDFFISLLIFLFCAWIRGFIHQGASYIMLLFLQVSISTFYPTM